MLGPFNFVEKKCANFTFFKMFIYLISLDIVCIQVDKKSLMQQGNVISNGRFWVLMARKLSRYLPSNSALERINIDYHNTRGYLRTLFYLGWFLHFDLLAFQNIRLSFQWKKKTLKQLSFANQYYYVRGKSWGFSKKKLIEIYKRNWMMTLVVEIELFL